VILRRKRNRKIKKLGLRKYKIKRKFKKNNILKKKIRRQLKVKVHRNKFKMIKRK
jgi:hypothetical protein